MGDAAASGGDAAGSGSDGAGSGDAAFGAASARGGVGDVRALVERLYAALGTGDEAALRGLLADDFRQEIAAGMPAGAGTRVGPDAAIRDGWWAIGAQYRVLAEPEEWLEVGDDRLVVVGTYRGAARATGAPVEAAFAHIWTAADGRLTALQQITDTARWG